MLAMGVMGTVPVTTPAIRVATAMAGATEDLEVVRIREVGQEEGVMVSLFNQTFVPSSTSTDHVLQAAIAVAVVRLAFLKIREID